MKILLTIFFLLMPVVTINGMDIPEYECEIKNSWDSGQLIFAKMQLHGRTLMHITIDCSSWLPYVVNSGCECDAKNALCSDRIAAQFMEKFWETLSCFGYHSFWAYGGSMPSCILTHCKQIAVKSIKYHKDSILVELAKL